MVWDTLQTFRSFMKRQNPNFPILTVRGACANLRWGLTQNYSSIYAVGLGADPVQLGSLSSFGNVVNVFLSASIGWFADRYSLKKMFLLGLVLESLAPLGYALSENWQMLVLPVIFFSITMVTTWTIERIFVVNALRDKDRATGFGVFSSISQIPMMFAPILAGLIVTWLGGISVEAIRPLFYISFIISALMLLVVHWKLQDSRANLASPREGFITSFRSALTGKRGIRRWLFMELLGSFTFSSTMPFIVVYAAEVKQADAMILGYMGSAMTIVSMLSSVPLGKLADKVGRKRTILLLRPAFCLSCVMLVWAPRPEFLILAFALRGILWSSLNAWMTMQMEMVPMDQRGRWSGTINMFTSIVSIPAPIIGGILWTYIDPSIPFLLVVLIDGAAIMPVLWTVHETQPS